MNVPLVDLGSLMLYATRRTTALPNMALIARFPGSLSRDELETEAKRIAANPYGLGRSLVRARVPGARPLWRANGEPRPVRLAAGADDAASLAAWFADETSVCQDPLDGAGWSLSAVHAGDSTFVSVSMNHLYGTGRDIVVALWGEEAYSVNGNGANGGERFPEFVEHDLRAEAADLGNRIRMGVRGIANLGGQVITKPRRRKPHGDVSTLRKPLDALLDRDKSRGTPSARRVAAFASVDKESWDAVLERHGGTGLALQIAVTANLLREARHGRGGPIHRPLRIIIPVDLADRSGGDDSQATLGPIELTSAGISLPGGMPTHGDLSHVRNVCRQAIAEARAEVAATGRVPVAPGMVDAMRLLPDAVTARTVFRVHSRFDGAASSMGPQLPGMSRLGSHSASDVFLLAFPLGSDISITMSEKDGKLEIGVIADPSRLGAGPALRDRVIAELAAWGMDASVW